MRTRWVQDLRKLWCVGKGGASLFFLKYPIQFRKNHSTSASEHSNLQNKTTNPEANLKWSATEIYLESSLDGFTWKLCYVPWQHKRGSSNGCPTMMDPLWKNIKHCDGPILMGCLQLSMLYGNEGKHARKHGLAATASRERLSPSEPWNRHISPGVGRQWVEWGGTGWRMGQGGVNQGQEGASIGGSCASDICSPFLASIHLPRSSQTCTSYFADLKRPSEAVRSLSAQGNKCSLSLKRNSRDAACALLVWLHLYVESKVRMGYETSLCMYSDGDS